MSAPRRRRSVLVLTLVAALWGAEPASLAAEEQQPPSRTGIETGLPKDINIEFEGQLRRSPEGDVEFTGPVRISWRGSLFQADRLTVRQERYLEAKGNVLLVWEGNHLFAKRATYDLEEERGQFEEVSGQVQNDYLFWARRVEKVGPNTLHLESARVTTCTQPNPYWSFAVSSATITINQYARMWNPRLKASKVPFFYLPFLVWPVKRDRAAGLLFPQFGSTQNRGDFVTQELFVPLGRSADLTLMGRYYTEAGLGGGGELRFIPNTQGVATLSGFFIDDKVDNRNRYRTTYQQTQMFRNGFRMVADLNLVSDFDYFSDFELDLDLVTSPTILTRLEFSRNDAWTSLNVRELRRKQLFSDGSQLVQQTLPEVEWRGRSRRLGRSPFYLSFESSLASIQQRGVTGVGAPELDADYLRADVYPTLSMPLSTLPWIEITPLLRYRYTYYTQSYDETGSFVVNDDLSRSLWGAGLDIIGPRIQRIFMRPDNPYSTKFKHVIEPRIVYGYQDAFEDLDAIIVYDEVDRFSGAGNEMGYSLTNRLFAQRPRSKPDTEDEGAAVELPQQRPAGDLGLDSQSSPFLPDVATPELDLEAPREPVEIASLVLSQSRSFDTDLSRADLDGDGTFEATSRSSPVRLTGRYNPSPTFSLDVQASYDILYNNFRTISFSGGLRSELARLRFSVFRSNGLGANTLDDTQMRVTGGFKLFGGKLSLNVDGSIDFDPVAGAPTVPDRRIRVEYATQCCTVLVEQLQRSFTTTSRDDWYLRIDLKGIGKILNVAY